MALPSQSRLPHPKYRPDIDGLRAIAVLSVILFHAFPGIFRGGFIGVDVFFVISGFLISTIIFESLDKGVFSFAEFYTRRIKRIFPALLLVLAASYAFGWFVLLAEEYRQLGKHVAAGAIFVSNLILWSEAGYFDNAAQTKPLLHLWSLGIEEQFYIVWPLLLWGAWKRKVSLPLLVSTLLMISFFYNVWCIEKFPVAAFYSPLSRFWELLCGSWLGWMTLKQNDKLAFLTTTQRNLLSICGISGIFFGVFVLSNDLLFPGWLALLPVFGSIFIIAAGPKAIVNRVFLSRKIVVWVGLISFPLYLWHWPLLSFARIIDSGTPEKYIIIIAVLSSFLLAWLTYVLIEKPVRFGLHGFKKVRALVLLMFCLGCYGIAVFSEDNLSVTRVSKFVNPEVVKALGDTEYPVGLNKVTFNDSDLYLNTTDEPEVLLFGDSHVEQISPRVVLHTKDGSAKNVVFMTGGGCAPIPFVYEDFHTDCFGFVDELNSYLEMHKSITSIVIGACWNCYFIKQVAPKQDEGDNYNYYYQNGSVKESFRHGQGKAKALYELGVFIKKLSAKYAIYVLLDNPMDKRFSPKYMLGGKQGRRHLVFDNNAGSQILNPVDFKIDEAQVLLNEEIKHVVLNSGALVINQIDLICPNGNCSPVDNVGRLIYTDTHHMRPFYVRESLNQIDAVILR